MKALVTILISLSLFVSCKNEEAKDDPQDSGRLADKTVPDPVDSSKFTTVQWLDSLKDFGQLKDGEKVDLTFRFKNTGSFPLIVESAHAGCGCTVPDYTREPVMPGREGFITASFNSSGQAATVRKTVNVVMNTKPVQHHGVTFTGTVIQKD